uniref:Uncharacterized protein n=1 Tax=Anopheles farauti TaxID=69004 RepID=A0A182QUH7_9DIPT
MAAADLLLDDLIISHGSSLESLHRYFPKSVLPAELGGELGPVQQFVDEWEQRLIDNRTYLIEEESLGVDESRRRTTNPFAEEKDPERSGSWSSIDGSRETHKKPKQTLQHNN